jgi:hypothetical protein
VATNKNRIIFQQRLIRESIREILREEIVSIFRNGKETVYDIDFDESQSITRGRLIDATDEYPEDVTETMKIASRFTSVDKATLLSKILDYKASGKTLRAPLSSGREAVAVLNGNFIDTFSWPRKNRKGPGEAAMHIAFNSDPNVLEPDFVGEDGGPRISIKYMGTSGNDTALTGAGSDSPVPSILNDLKQVLGIGAVSNKAISEKDVYQSLTAIENPDDRQAALDLAWDSLSTLKSAIVTEHGADGTLLISDSTTYYVNPQSAQQMIKIIYIKGSRVDFAGLEWGNSKTSFEKALYRAQAELDAAKQKK